MADKSQNQEQMELLDESDESLTAVVPRSSDVPLTKNTDASASAFGWFFQVVTGVILSILNIRHLKTVEIEGKTEDIELFFDDKDPEYVQVKAIQQNYLEVKSPAKANAAMNTLINTSNITEGKYSKLVYVANFRNPLSLPETLLSASWKPEEDSIFLKKYEYLPAKGKKFIDSRIKAAQKQLRDANYESKITYLDLDKLYIATILLGSEDYEVFSDQSMEMSHFRGLRVLNGVIEQLFTDARISIRHATSRRIRDSLTSYYFANAGYSELNDQHQTISKKKLVWRIIFELLEDSNLDLESIVPFDCIDEVDDYVSFIQEQAENITVIGKVYAEASKQYLNARLTANEVDEFINNNWEKFTDEFPVQHDAEIQEYGTKALIKMILSQQRSVKKIMRAVNMS